MGFEEKTPDLLALLTAHAGGSFPTVVVVTQPPTPAPTRTFSMKAANKKWKKAQGDKGTEGAKEGEVTQSSHQPSAKEVWIEIGQQKKTSSIRTAKDRRDQPKKPTIWRPLFTLSPGNPVLDDANLKDPQKGSSGLVVEYLEKALCLPKDMAEPRSFRKLEVFLALKQDLAMVHDCFP